MDQGQTHPTAGEAMFPSILDAMPQAIFWKDAQGVFQGCNAGFLRIAGLSRVEEVVGRDDFQLPWGRNLARTYRADDQWVLETGETKTHIEECLINAAGQCVWLETTKVPLKDAEGRITGLLGTCQDISDKKRMERNLTQNRMFTSGVLDVIPGMLFMIDDSGRLVHWNHSTARMTGFSDEELGGMDVAGWFPGKAESAEVRRAMERVLANGHGELEVWLTHRDGRKILFYFTGVSFVMGAKAYITGIGLDITERKKAEYELRLLEQQNEALKRSEALQRDLAHMVVHDLRSPLTVVLHSLEVLGEELPPGTEQRLRTCVSHGLKGALRLRDMIDQLLQVSRLESGEMPVHPTQVELGLLVQASLAAVDPQGRVVLAIPEGLEVFGDPDLLLRVVDNLLGNALKFTPVPGRVELCAMDQGSQVRVEVRDEGPGVAETDRERIFDKFAQGHAGNPHRGLGLGLALCRLGVQRMGGVIGIDCQTGHGSTFWFTLPRG